MTAPLTVPVLWLSLNPDAIARGYWDQGLLEDLFAGDGWAPPGGVVWEHHEHRAARPGAVPQGLPDHGVVIIGARHHADPPVAEALARVLAGMRWALLLACGDEEGALPLAELERLPGVEVWPQIPQPDRLGGRWLPNGYPPGLRAFLRELGPQERRWEWVFAGQVTHARREEAAGVLRRMRDSGHLLETQGFTQGAPQEQFWTWLAQARTAPCPSGPCHVDSFRAWEALEAGAVPVVETTTGQGHSQAGYWSVLGVPFPVVSSWDEIAGLARQITRRWPADANAAGAWWIGQKREIAWALQDTCRRLAGAAPPPTPTPDELITVVVPTSPCPEHPSTAALEETLASVRARLPTAEVLLVMDPPRPELQHRRDAWLEYQQRVVRMANLDWTNVLPVVFPEWQHQALAVRSALPLVRTPLLLFVEHDTPLVGPLPLPELVPPLLSGEANVIRLYHEVEVHPDHRHLMLDAEPQPVGPAGVPLLRTRQWSQRPHLARTDFYRDRILARFTRRSRTMIEDAIHGLLEGVSEAGWWDWRVWLYHPDTPLETGWTPEGQGGGIKRSTHLDSRGSDPKFAMVYNLRDPQ